MGFRKGHSSLDNITRLEIDVCNSLKIRHVTMAVLFDWTDAYGNVVHNKLLEILINPDFPYSFISLYADNLIIWKSGRDIGLLQNLIQKDISLVQRFSLSFGFPISISNTKAIIFTNGSTDPLNPLTIFSREIPYCNSVKLLGLLMDSKMQWHEHINSLKSLIIQRLCILKRLA